MNEPFVLNRYVRHVGSALHSGGVVRGAPPRRVLLGDEHTAAREQIRLALERGRRFEVCAEARDASAAISAAVATRPHVCLLDVNMPGSGVAAAWEIAARLPETRVVMLTDSDEDVDIFAALRSGADGYLLKDIDSKRLPRALELVLAGEVLIPRRLVNRLVEELRDPAARRRATVANGHTPHLTSREWQVLELLRDDMTTAQIAQRLVLSPVTVRTHVNSIFRKLGLRGRDELQRHFSDR